MNASTFISIRPISMILFQIAFTNYISYAYPLALTYSLSLSIYAGRKLFPSFMDFLNCPNARLCASNNEIFFLSSGVFETFS